MSNKKAALLLALLLINVIGIFWYQELRFLKPTPVPINYQTVLAGQAITLVGTVPLPTGRPVFLHFINPDCPCSRFNMPRYKQLVEQYQDKIQFCAVLQVADSSRTISQFQMQYSLTIPVILDAQNWLPPAVYILLHKRPLLMHKANFTIGVTTTDHVIA